MSVIIMSAFLQAMSALVLAVKPRLPHPITAIWIMSALLAVAPAQSIIFPAMALAAAGALATILIPFPQPSMLVPAIL